ncbi:hypothetical protein P3T39_004455 [Kitasatospora sp. GP82]|nr:hypothetical protein [Kitasatospora sp. GP82]
MSQAPTLIVAPVAPVLATDNAARQILPTPPPQSPT